MEITEIIINKAYFYFTTNNILVMQDSGRVYRQTYHVYIVAIELY
jgi:hypothetical protein